MTRSYLPSPRLAAATFVAALLVLFTAFGASAPRAEERVTIENAHADVTRLKDELDKRKSSNEDLIASLEAVAKAYVGGIQELPAPAADASPDVLKAHEAEKVKHARAVEAFRKEARNLFEKALTVQVLKGQKDEKTNEREDVNIKAFQIIGQTHDPDLVDDVMRAIETSLAKAKYTVSTGLWEAAFASLAHLSDTATPEGEKSTKKAVGWIIENYTHANSSPEEAVEQLIAAHKSIPLYKRIPQEQRHKLFGEMIKSYVGKESQAEQSKNDPKNQAAKVFWDRIKTDVIKAMQYISKSPVDDKSQALSTMKDFLDWFRDHEKLGKEPWVGDLSDMKPATEEKKPEEKKEGNGGK